MIYLLLFITLVLSSLYLVSQNNQQVDRFSWDRHAYFLRLRGYQAFPLRLDNQFCLESSESYYPQFFIYLYSFFGQYLSLFKYGTFIYTFFLTSIFIFGLSIFSSFNPLSAALTFTIVLSSPLVLSVNRQILPRYLGDLLISFLYLCCVMSDSSVLLFACSFIVSYIVIGLHKMSLQLLIFFLLSSFVLIPAQSIYSFLGFLSAISVFSFIFPGYNYASKQFTEHFAILAFWRKNISRLGTPIFNSSGSHSSSLTSIRNQFFVRNVLFFLPLLFISNFDPLSITYDPGPSFATQILSPSPSNSQSLFLLSPLIFSFFTILPWSSFLGSALFYMTVPYISFSAYSIFKWNSSAASLAPFYFIIALNLLVLFVYFLFSNKTSTVHFKQDAIVEYLSSYLSCSIAVFPYNYADKYASLLSSHRFLWGAHGAGGWDLLGQVFPNMRLTYDQLVETHNIKFFIVNDSLNDSFCLWFQNSDPSAWPHLVLRNSSGFSLYEHTKA